ncbi:unnamed protein product [Polarella glacialis]|uniref:Uncharacterized protein n=1 Tax=Polarella glacialis TaxID=89957 RepID=A0A813L0W2_POLGL|nr:unnamed protein product [Polarella glacialis]
MAQLRSFSRSLLGPSTHIELSSDDSSDNGDFAHQSGSPQQEHNGNFNSNSSSSTATTTQGTGAITIGNTTTPLHSIAVGKLVSAHVGTSLPSTAALDHRACEPQRKIRAEPTRSVDSSESSSDSSSDLSLQKSDLPAAKKRKTDQKKKSDESWVRGTQGRWHPFRRDAEEARDWSHCVAGKSARAPGIVSLGCPRPKFRPHISGGTRHRLLYRGHRLQSRQLETDCLRDPAVKEGIRPDNSNGSSSNNNHNNNNSSSINNNDNNNSNNESGSGRKRLLRVPRKLLDAFSHELLGEVRYLPQHVALSWRAHEGVYQEKKLGHRTVPHDLCGPMPQEPMRLLSNSSDEAAEQPLYFERGDHPLRPEQLKSLAWMLSREGHGVELQPFVVEWRGFETNWEYTLEQWMLELRAIASYPVRGGILADQVGYGKTATTIALISATLGAPRPEVPAASGTNRARLKSATGTLVLMPTNLLYQWLNEISKFLCGGQPHSGGEGRWDSTWPLKVVVVSDETSVASLNLQVLAKADVILCPYSHLFSKSFKLLSQMYWQRLVFDEFHELAGFDGAKQSSLQLLHARSRWGLTGTPPISDVASVIFMSSLFRVDLPGCLLEEPRAWDSDLFMWRMAHTFLDHFARQNTTDLQHIGLVEHIVVVQQTPEERALYLLEEVGQLDRTLEMAEHLHARREETKLESVMKKLERLLRLCSHFSVSDEGSGSASDECKRVGDLQRQCLEEARLLVLRRCRPLVLLEWLPELGPNEAAGSLLAEFAETGQSGLQAGEEYHQMMKSAGAELKEMMQQGVSEGMEKMLAESLKEMLQEALCEEKTHKAAISSLVELMVPAIQQGEGFIFDLQESGLAAHIKKKAVITKLTKIQAKVLEQQAGSLRKLREAIAADKLFSNLLATLKQGNDSSRSCSICMCDALPLEKLAITPCAHIFCWDCIKALDGNGQLEKCAICRQPLSGLKSIRRITAEILAEPKEEPEVAEKGTEVQVVDDTLLSQYGTKLEAVTKKLLEIRKEDPTAKVILFVQFEDLKSKVLCALLGLGIPALELKGTTLQRANVIRDWQENASSERFVLLLSLAESASGTNLTAAGHVVFLHPMLAATRERGVAQELQAIGRARRHGQRAEAVHVWRFVTAAETVEQIITQRHQKDLWGAQGEELPRTVRSAAALNCIQRYETLNIPQQDLLEELCLRFEVVERIRGSSDKHTGSKYYV